MEHCNIHCSLCQSAADSAEERVLRLKRASGEGDLKTVPIAGSRSSRKKFKIKI